MKWPTGALDSIAILDRQSIHPSEAEAATPYIGLEHIDGDGGINCIQTVGSAGIKSNKFQFSDRHVLFGKLRPYLRKIAKPRFSGVCSTDIIPILPKDGVSRDYLFYFLRTPDIVNLATNRCSGVNLPRLSPKQLASFQIPLPPLIEQKRIAEILDAADALRAKRREALTQLDTLIQSIFLDKFGDPNANPMGWTEVALGAHTSKIGSGATPLGGKAAYKKDGIALIRSMNVRDGHFSQHGLAFIDGQQAARLDGVVVEPDDVLLNITGASVARVCRAPHNILPARVNQHVAIIRPTSGFDQRFLEQCLLFPSMKHRLLRIAGAGATREAITKDAIMQLIVVQPPRNEQDRFAAIVESVERQKASQLTHLAELDTLFASLQSRAFRGDL